MGVGGGRAAKPRAGCRRWYAAWLGGSALASLAIASPATADQTWIGATSGDWFTGSNWSGSAVPTGGDNVTINTTTPHTATIGHGGTATAGELTVGNSATGTLAITGGSQLLPAGRIYIGRNAGSSGLLTLDGTNTAIVTANNVYLGYDGSGTLAIRGSAGLTGTYMLVGANAGSTGQLTVDGPTSHIYLNNDLHVGTGGTGTASFTNGATLWSSQLVIGTSAGANGTVTVDGQGTTVSPQNYIIVGDAGTGTLNITHGGSVSGGGQFGISIGESAGGVGTVNVSGAGSTFTSQWSLTVGNYGTGTLNVTNGGQATASAMYVGFSAGSSGTVTIGSGGQAGIGVIYVGMYQGASGTMTIASGGQAAVGSLFVGATPGSTGALTVDGAGSILAIANSLATGYMGTGNTQISNGGQIKALSSATILDVGVNGSGTLSIDGAGSSLNAAGAELQLGRNGGSGTLAITHRGTATVGTATLAGGGGNSAITVDGAGSQFKADTLTLGGSGTGTLTVSNGGNVTTTHAIAVGTTSTINIGAAIGATPTGAGTIAAPGIDFGSGNGTIVFNHTNANYAFTTPLSGSGNVDVEAGTTVFSTTQGYTGVTFVNGGQLIVTGDISSSGVVLVGTGGTLGGTGRVPFTLLDTGTLAPGVGNTIGTLTVNDRVMFCACSTLAVKVSASGSDLVRIVPGSLSNGDAVLDGTVKVSSPTANYRFGKPYTILTAPGGLNDTTFASLVIPFAGMSGRLSYTNTDVLLTLTSQLASTPGLNRNQQAVAYTLDAALNAGGASGGLGALFGAPAASFTQATGESATGSQQTTFNAMNAFLGGLLDHGGAGFDGGSGGPIAFADSNALGRTAATRDAYAMITKAAPTAEPFAARWNVWAGGFGGSQTTDGNAVIGSGSTTSRIGGGMVGADYRLSRDTLVGFALAGGGTSFSVAGSGSGRSDLFQAGAFVRHTMGTSYLTAAFAYGWQDITTDRTVTLAGADRLQARFNANAFSGRIEGGRRIATPWFGLTPYAAVQATAYNLPAYVEQTQAGAGSFALAYGAKGVTDTRTELGVRVDRSFALTTALLTLRGRAYWVHDFNPDRSIAATFQTLPGASFVVNGAAQAQNAALTTAAAELSWTNGFSVAATFEGEFSEISRSYGGKGTLRYQW
ncbi:autotransporter outer membrane beta-barrel domain-containing protein [Bradyrhizobium sp. 2TAF24]|uniref:autotransporter outer membrane beta-barrel domain-containing protein n=1 Tax=Bradyrhizobium sp. 2TAF24 TaxID=3233011 RepID=UPI003F8DBF6F